MIYKQNVWTRADPPSAGGTRIDDERKLLELWREQEVDDDYQAVVLHFLDGLQSKGELHRQIQAELRRTYQRDSHFFRIDKLMQERERTLAKLGREVEQLERFKSQRGDPNLEPVCLLLDHTRKIHLLIAEEVHEMFNTYGHPSRTRVGFTFLSLFREFDEEVQFLKDSLLKFYMPFSGGFDPLFLQLSQRLRKCYANESLVYDQHIEELINLNASYLYRLLRAHQRMIQAISVADRKDDEPSQFFARGRPSPTKGRSILDSIAEEEPKARSTQPSERFESSRFIRDDSHRFSTPKNTEAVESQYQYPRSVSPVQRKVTAEVGVQKQAPRLQLIKQNIKIARQKDRILQERAPLLLSMKPSPMHSPSHSEQVGNKMVRTPRKVNKPYNSTEEQQSKPLHFYRKIQSPPPPPTISHIRNSHKRTHTEGNTIIKRKPQESRLKQFLPKLNDSRGKGIDVKAECLCRQRYRDRHCDHQEQEQLSEGELQRRRKAIVREIQAKYKAMAQREARHQLSKLGDATYHKLRNQEHTRQSRTVKNAHPA